MDLFNLLASPPPQGKKRKIGEHGEGPQPTPEKCERAQSTDVKNDVFEETPVKEMSVGQRLKEWGLDEQFTVCGGSSLGCITCMKYGTWREQEEEAGRKKKYLFAVPKNSK